MSTKFVDMTKRKFGRLMVIRRSNRKSVCVMWECLCRCGNKITTRGTALRNGKTTSCGCFNREQSKKTNRKHGLSGSLTYVSWKSMLNRCFDKTHPSYPEYGGRGIVVCKRWMNVEQFVEDMGIRPDKQYTVERNDNDGNYEPGNCRWATKKEQARNRRNSVILEYQDKRLHVNEWAKITGLSCITIRKRIQAGWTVKDSLTKKSRKWRKFANAKDN